MVKLEAIIQNSKLDAVKTALQEIGVEGMTVPERGKSETARFFVPGSKRRFVFATKNAARVRCRLSLVVA